MNEESRIKLHQRFMTMVAQNQSVAEPVAAHELAGLSRTLGTQLPGAYVEFLRCHGAIVCPGMTPDLRDVPPTELRQLLPPGEVVKMSRAMWCDLLPVDMFVFGFDALGNVLCFPHSGQARDDAPVFTWSAHHERLFRFAESFDELLTLSLKGS